LDIKERRKTMPDTIVMIHGMWVGGWFWNDFKQFFKSRGYECITPTLRYHDVEPNAPPHPDLGRTSLLDFAEDLETEIRNLEQPPILLGVSMGGLLAQILASRGLARILVLISSAAPSGIMALKLSVIRSFLSGFKTWGFWRKPMRQTFNEAAYSMMHLLSIDEQKNIYGKFGYESGRAASEIGFWIFDTKRATKVDESKVNCPVLVIACAEDRIVPPSISRKVAKKYEAVSTYKEFPDHAHWIAGVPGWQKIADYIAQWLTTVK
jgi:non-heme chloroperoxidase